MPAKKYGFILEHQVPGFSLKEGLDFLPCSGCFATHSSLSLIALHGMNIPMYGAIKRCTPLVNLVLSVVILKKAMPSALLIASIALITAGAFVASLGDLQFEPYAYSMGTLSVLAQAAYLTLIQRNAEFNHRSTVEMLHITSLTTLPIFLTMSLIIGEPEKIKESASVLEPGFCMVFLLLLVSGRFSTAYSPIQYNSNSQLDGHNFHPSMPSICKEYQMASSIYKGFVCPRSIQFQLFSTNINFVQPP